MIVRTILDNLSIADNFDFPNDFGDTMDWLKELKNSDYKYEVVKRLAEARQRWVIDLR